MKKLAAVLSLLVCLPLLLISCGELDVNPDKYVTLGTYKGVTIELDETVNVTDAQVQKQIESNLESGAETEVITNRAVKKGDTANIDFDGKIDGKAFDGGSTDGAGYDLEIGSGSMIDGFEDQIIGHKLGEKFDITVTFPKDYGTEGTDKAKLNGKKAVFTIKINKITAKVLPDLTDAYVKAAFGAESVAAYRKSVREELETTAKEKIESEKESLVWAAVTKNAKFGTLPQKEIDEYVSKVVSQYESQISSQYSGQYTLEQYLAASGSSLAEFKKTQQTNGETYVKKMMMILAIANKENLMPSKEQYVSQAKKIAEEYSYDSLSALESAAGKKTVLRELILQDKVTDLLVKNCKVVKPSTTTTTTGTGTTTGEESSK